MFVWNQNIHAVGITLPLYCTVSASFCWAYLTASHLVFQDSISIEGAVASVRRSCCSFSCKSQLRAVTIPNYSKDNRKICFFMKIILIRRATAETGCLYWLLQLHLSSTGFTQDLGEILKTYRLSYGLVMDVCVKLVCICVDKNSRLDLSPFVSIVPSQSSSREIRSWRKKWLERVEITFDEVWWFSFVRFVSRLLGTIRINEWSSFLLISVIYVSGIRFSQCFYPEVFFSTVLQRCFYFFYFSFTNTCVFRYVLCLNRRLKHWKATQPFMFCMYEFF